YLDMLQYPPEGCPETAQGTLRKAGKWVYGPAWEPETAVLQAPGEEIARLRVQIATLEDQAKMTSAALASANGQIKFLTEELGVAVRQRDYLKSGKTQQELHMLGIAQTESNLGR